MMIPYRSHRNVTTVADNIKGNGNDSVLFVRITSPWKSTNVELNIHYTIWIDKKRYKEKALAQINDEESIALDKKECNESVEKFWPHGILRQLG